MTAFSYQLSETSQRESDQKAFRELPHTEGRRSLDPYERVGVLRISLLSREQIEESNLFPGTRKSGFDQLRTRLIVVTVLQIVDVQYSKLFSKTFV
jgi:hypothetical protein